MSRLLLAAFLAGCLAACLACGALAVIAGSTYGQLGPLRHADADPNAVRAWAVFAHTEGQTTVWCLANRDTTLFPPILHTP